MRNLQYSLILALLVAVGVAYRQLHEIQVNNPLRSSAPSEKMDSTMLAEAAGSAPAVATNTASSISEIVKAEAEMISQLSDRPDEIEKRIRELAGKMKDSDIPVLQEYALNPNVNGDQRFLAVYILGESTLATAQESLEAIATAPIPESRESRLMTQEEVIRGQAVESIRKAEILKRILAHSDNGFINDRAQRNLLYLQGKAASPEQQDREALNQLLKKTSQ